MNSPAGKRIAGVLGLLLAGVAVYYLIGSFASGVREAGGISDLLSFSPLLFVLSFLAVNAHLLAAAWSWQLVCGAAGSPVTIRQAYTVHYLSQIGKYIPGKVWAAIGKVGLSRRIGMPGVAAGHALVLESIYIVAGCLLTALPLIPSSSSALGIGPWAASGAVLAGVAVLLVLAHPVTFRKLVLIAGKIAGRRIETVHTGFLRVLGLLPVYLSVFLSLGVSFVILAWSFGLELPLIPGMFLFPAAMGIGYVVIFAPGGLGIREVSLVWLVELVCPGAEHGLPELVAIASRLWITLAEGLAFLLSVFLWEGKGPVLKALRGPSPDNGDEDG